MKRRPVALLIGSVIVAVSLGVSLLGPWISPYSATEQDIIKRLQRPSTAYLLGTDQYGRDLLSRTLIGGRTALLLGIGAVALGLIFGVPLGLASGYFGGRVDNALMRFVDAMLSFPSLLLALQASIVRLLMEIRTPLRASYLLISHDLSLVRHVADRVGVMYLGKLVEVGTVDEIYRPPSHPYTRALLSAVPRPDPLAPRTNIRLEGQVPSAQRPPSGCRFHTRCPEKVGRICEEMEPPLLRAGEHHWIACHIPLDALRREPPVLSAALAAAGPGAEPHGEPTS